MAGIEPAWTTSKFILHWSSWQDSGYGFLVARTLL